MMQSMLRVAAMAALMGVALAGRSQTVVKGRLVDAENGEPLVGAQVRLTGEKTGVVTNAEGEFTLKNPARRREVTVSYLGFKTQNFGVAKSGDMGTLSLTAEDVALEGVTVYGTMAFDRKTPVALSNITIDEIEEKLYTNDFLNDARFCHAYVHDKVEYQAWGRLKIQAGLRALQLPEKDIRAALEELNEEKYRDNLRALIAQRKSDSEDKRLRFLLQRGFTYEEIRLLSGLRSRIDS